MDGLAWTPEEMELAKGIAHLDNPGSNPWRVWPPFPAAPMLPEYGVAAHARREHYRRMARAILTIRRLRREGDPGAAEYQILRQFDDHDRTTILYVA